MADERPDTYWHGYFKMACRSAMHALEAGDTNGALSILKASLAAAERVQKEDADARN